MAFSRLFLVLFLATISSLTVSSADSNENALEPIQLVAPDGSVRANFIRYGATVTDFYVKDKKGVFRDILLGFDNHTFYQNDAEGHPYFGAIVGRYANRIRNGTFTIPISKDASGSNRFFVPQNEGNNTLHGGFKGYDRRVWKLQNALPNSATFILLDPAGTEGFPGTVSTTVTYTLERNATWNININAVASTKTPIMLTGHHYWNFEAYQESQDLNVHYAQSHTSRFVATDGNLIPTGELLSVDNTPMDFRKARSVGISILETTPGEFCGTGCVGFDNCWLFDEVQDQKPVFSIWNNNSGIKLDIFTNQPALQIYTCNFIFNAELPIPRKKSQGGPSGIYTDHSCIAIENESVIDAINNPEFGVNQIYGPGRPYNWEASYIFSTL